MSFFSIFRNEELWTEFQQFSVNDSGPAFKGSHMYSNWCQSVDIAFTALIFNTKIWGAKKEISVRNLLRQHSEWVPPEFQKILFAAFPVNRQDVSTAG